MSGHPFGGNQHVGIGVLSHGERLLYTRLQSRSAES
jgi:hypothetical protein